MNMNSWLGGGLSSLKGQLSHLISEGTEEVKDPAADLIVAQKRIADLESQLNVQTNEMDYMKERNNDLLMKLQSEELLLQNVSDSYRDKLRHKESVIEGLTNQLTRGSAKDVAGRPTMESSDDNDQWTGTMQKPSSVDDNKEVEELRKRTAELENELVKWKSMQFNNQTDPEEQQLIFEETLNKLLQDKERQMELEHGDSILQLQYEHNKQISFLNQKIFLLEQGQDGVNEFRLTDSAEVWNCEDDDQEELSNKHQDEVETILKMIGTKLGNKQLTAKSIIDLMHQCCEDVDWSELHLPRHPNSFTGGPDPSHSTSARPTLKTEIGTEMVQKQTVEPPQTNKDSVAASSPLWTADDISGELSTKSRILDEHVRHLSNQIIDSYEHLHFADLHQHQDRVNETTQEKKGEKSCQQKENEKVDVFEEGEEDEEEGKILSRIEALKLKLAQRKHVSSVDNKMAYNRDGNRHGYHFNQPDTEILDEEKMSNNFADSSWETSSINSLVDEPQNSLDLSQQHQSMGHYYFDTDGVLGRKMERSVRKLYDLLFPPNDEDQSDLHHVSCDATKRSTLFMLETISKTFENLMTEMTSAEKEEQKSVDKTIANGNKHIFEGWDDGNVVTGAEGAVRNVEKLKRNLRQSLNEMKITTPTIHTSKRPSSNNECEVVNESQDGGVESFSGSDRHHVDVVDIDQLEMKLVNLEREKCQLISLNQRLDQEIIDLTNVIHRYEQSMKVVTMVDEIGGGDHEGKEKDNRTYQITKDEEEEEHLDKVKEDRSKEEKNVRYCIRCGSSATTNVKTMETLTSEEVGDNFGKRNKSIVMASMSSQDILEHVETFTESKDELIQLLESRIVSLQNLCEEKDDTIDELTRQRLAVMYEYDSTVDVLKSELESLRTNLDQHADRDVEWKKNERQLRDEIIAKDVMIRSLNEELMMLSVIHNDDEEQVEKGNRNFDGEHGGWDSCGSSKLTAEENGKYFMESSQGTKLLSELEDRIKYLELENERLETIVKKKAVCSSEFQDKVDGLEKESCMNITGFKAMTETSDHHLSQLIQDKDWEIEALRSRTESLCDVIRQLQEQPKQREYGSRSDHGDENNDKDVNNDQRDNQVTFLDSLVEEKEALVKELKWYQENRDQLISSLNAKHAESVNYHGELQRLVGYINEEQGKWNEILFENEELKERIKMLENGVVAAAEDRSSSSPAHSQSSSSQGVEQGHHQEKTGQRQQEQSELRMLHEQIDRTNFELQQAKIRIIDLESVENQSKSCEHCRRLIPRRGYSHGEFFLEGGQERNNRNNDEDSRCHKDSPPSSSSSYGGLQNNRRRTCSLRLDGDRLIMMDFTKGIWQNEETVDTHQQSQNDMTYKNEDGNDGGHGIDNNEALRWYQQFCHKSIECDQLLNQIEQLKAKEQKLLKEKQIFQDHLITIEESYTQEATLAEDREQTLRQKLRLVEDNLQISTNELSKIRQHISTVQHECQTELQSVKCERDQYRDRLNETEIQLQENSKSLCNLQSVLDTFQQEQTAEMIYQKERMAQNLNRITNERDKLELQCCKLQNQLDEQCEIVETARRLADQMDQKEDHLANIQAQLAKKEEQIDGLKMEIRMLNTFTESKVDKVLMKNLIIGYFHTPQHRRQEALKVIGSLLQFADTDYLQIGIDIENKSRWFSWLRSNTAEDKMLTEQSASFSGKSFSELFVSFLEKESAPLPKVKLPPTNQIAAEAKRYHSSFSQSKDYPYMTQSMLYSTVAPDQHQNTFTSSLSKRNNNSVNDEQPETSADITESKKAPFLHIPDISSDFAQKEQKSTSGHRRSESNRNALLNLLDQ